MTSVFLVFAENVSEFVMFINQAYIYQINSYKTKLYTKSMIVQYTSRKFNQNAI